MKLKDKIEILQKKIKKIKSKLDKNKSLRLKGISVTLIIVLMFFLSSNLLLNKEFNVKSTEINKQQVFNNIQIELLNREYNANTGLVEQLVKIKNLDLGNNIDLSFSAIEKHDLAKVLKVDSIKISDDKYVFYTKVPLNWSALCLKITNKNSQNGYVKIYSSSGDTKVNNDLVIKDEIDCKIKFVDLDIEQLKKLITDLNSKIEKNNANISTIEGNVSSIEADKKYMTDEESKDGNAKIAASKTTIKTLESENLKMKNEIKEYNKRIENLEKKKIDLKNS